MSHEPLRESWFEQRVSAAPSSLPPLPSLPPPRRAGDPVWSAGAGAGAGVVGALVALLTTDCLGAPVRALHQPDTLAQIAVVTSLVGALVGGVFGRLARRLFRPLPRIVFAGVLASALWLFAYAFVLMRFSPAIGGAFTFARTVLGALAYGACVGAVPPIRARDERGRSA